MALTSVLPVFIGQNLGAGKKKRVTRGLSLSWKFSLIYGISVYIILFLSGRRIGGFFNPDQNVINTVALYLSIVPAAYCFRNMMDLSVTALSVSGKPVHGALISIIQMFVLYIPLANAGSLLFGLAGIFGSLSVSLLLVGPVSFLLTERHIRKMSISEKTS